MIAYKGFETGLVCRGYQFQMGLNVTEKANCRANGFHCAEDPLDCLTYYGNIRNSEYYIVDAGGDIDEDGLDTKISCTELTVIKRLSVMELFMHALAFMVDHPKREEQPCCKGQGECTLGICSCPWQRSCCQRKSWRPFGVCERRCQRSYHPGCTDNSGWG